MEIKAIETQYKGYRFRSRLEARWAIFFDDLGLKWVYEEEGFQLSDTRYLPDFKIVTGNRPVYVEIKPSSNQDVTKAKKFAAETDQLIYVFCGDPFDALPPMREMPDDKPKESKGAAYFFNGKEAIAYFSADLLGILFLLGKFDADVLHMRDILFGHEQDAFYSAEHARSARFEFGENG